MEETTKRISYKNLNLEDVKAILSTPDIFDTISDDDAFDLMQRYKELTEHKIPNDEFEGLE
jgi:hypothetical protein